MANQRETCTTPPEAANPSLPEIRNDFANKHIVSMDQFNATSVMTVIKVAEEMRKKIENHEQLNTLAGIRILPVFFEPSTRTRLSTESAGKCLGAIVLTPLTDPDELSLKKGESIKHTVRVFEANADIIVIRDKDEHFIYDAIKAAKTAIFINAGNGKYEHPTQGLQDLKTLYDKFHRLDHLNIVVGGDSSNGRATRSLYKGLSLFEGNTVYPYAPHKSQLDRETVSDLEKKGLKVNCIENEEELPRDANALYWIRPQLERIKGRMKRKRIANILNAKYGLTAELMHRRYANVDLSILHCLPIIKEVESEIDDDPRSEYLDRQIKNGIYTRMALLALVSGRINPNMIDYQI
jgi:aspartate carbamoyltransferase catalytic subunit